MKLFGSGLITRPACTSCPAKGYARVSDLTLGDFWGIWDIRPELDDDRGISLVLVQTKKGQAALEGLEAWPVTLEESSRENPAVIRAASENPRRSEAMELVRSGDFSGAALLLPATAPTRTPGILPRAAQYLKRKLGKK